MKQSAGILLFKKPKEELFFFLVHPGGPFWKNKDLGSWSIPKGEFTNDEMPLEAAIREFEEETGQKIAGDFLPLTPVTLKSGKVVHAWALGHDIDATHILSNTFELEWPPKSGKMINVPEVDKGAWFSIEESLLKINPAQADFIRETVSIVTT